MEKTYDPKLIEDEQYQLWLRGNYFRSEVDPSRSRFSIVIPPPNVTGSLHVGHALDLTLQDVIVRWQRMLGKNALWVPGTDHAGIGTQMVVERELAKEKISRFEIGREAFEQRAWQWKEYSHGLITQRLQKLGASVDWSRERFTLDEGLSRAVRTAFVQLFRESLIYKGEYVVNWCPRCKTALSDLEVRHEQTEGQLHYVRYPIQGEKEFITVATTRPETMLGDTAIAVHPEDERYRHLVGKTAIQPLLNRPIPVIADSFVNREFGTGAVKITPAHDPNDFLAAQRNNIPALLVIDGDGKMLPPAGPYAGLDRFEARKRVIEDLTSAGLLVRQEKHIYALGKCDRCKTIVEPLLSAQWFVKIASLAAPAIEAVEKGEIRFYPESWTRVYFEWMRNIHDWCISRQLWWGHRIPVWNCEQCSRMTSEVDTPQKCAHCGSANIRQETDVLDTWFSSGLWPFSVFGWPDQTPELNYYYPTNLLITGFDIIFFWVARMIMLGLKFTGKVPFRETYIHGLVRDEHGQKMSKSRGNVIDPMEVIDEYGTDAMRFALAVLAVPGPDIPLSTKRVQGYKAFLNKLWNSVRFALLKVNENDDLTPLPVSSWDLGDRWITSRFHRVAGEINSCLSEYRFDLAANAAYQFLWHEFCDWYIEWIKPHLSGDTRRASGKKGLLLERVSDVLKLLHPFVPFVTEYLYQQIPERARSSKALMIAKYPQRDEKYISIDSEDQFALLMEFVGKIRQVRTEMNIEPSKKIHVFVKGEPVRNLVESQEKEVRLLARCERLEFVSDFPQDKQLARGVLKDAEIGIDLAGVLNLQNEKDRLQKELRQILADLSVVEKKLSNEKFLSNAPAPVVEEQKAKFEELNMRKNRTEEHLQTLG
ncbi:valine--tRNA ligase [bacterium]|nr:valine--tRNA ligase [bacterium]